MRQVDYKKVYGNIAERLKNAYNGATRAAKTTDDKITVGECSGLLMAQRIVFEAWKEEVVKDD